MSEANRQVVREIYERYRRREWPELLEAFFHEDAEWVDPPDFPDPDVHRGHAAILAFHRSWDETWGPGWDMQLGEIRGEGDVIFSRARFTGHGKASGAATPFEFFQIWTFREGKVTRVEVTLDHDRALAALSQADRL